MKKPLLLLIMAVLFPAAFYAQNEPAASKPIVEIFADFHASLNQYNTNPAGFALNRAFFGYNFAFDKNFYAVLILNAGSPDELPDGAKPRRYAFLREASANYTNERLTVTMGMIKTTLFIFQQTFLGMRYIARPLQDQCGYGTDSDLGVSVSYNFAEKLQGDFSVINGEGGGNLAIDNNLKYCAGLIFRPAKNFVIRLYDDIMKNKGVIQNESLLFAGLRNERLFIGGECNYKTNVDTVSGHNSYGISATGGVNISEKLLLFSRYDFASSLQPDMYSDNWNYKKDYQFIIAGVQYTFAKSLRVSLDYQARIPYDRTVLSSHMIFLNLGFRI